MIINLAKIRFGGSGGGTSPAKPEDFFQETYTANGNYDVAPQAGHVFSGGTVTVNVQGSGDKPEETFDITPTNSDQSVTPTTGSVFSSGTVRGYDVDPIYGAIEDLNIGEVQPVSGSFVVPEGMKFRGSTFTTIPSGLDFSQISDGGEMFYACYNLTGTPQIGSNLTNMHGMFRECSSMINISDLDTSNVTIMDYAFTSCSSLSNIPSLDLSSCISLNYTFAGSAITSFSLDTANVHDFYNIFESCNNLTSIIDLDLTNSYLGSNPPDMFGWGGLPSVTRCTLKGSLNRTTSFAELPNIGSESIQSILTAAANTILPSDEKSLIFNHTFSEAEGGILSTAKAAAEAKGWTVEGLTINIVKGA